MNPSTTQTSRSSSCLFVFFKDNTIKDDLFCRPSTTTTKADNDKETISTFFEREGLEWDKLVCVCTDGSPAMLTRLQVGVWFVTLVKQKTPEVMAIHCMINREVLVSITLPEPLRPVLKHAIKTVNCVKKSVLNMHLFRSCARTLTHRTLICSFTQRSGGFQKAAC